MLIWRTRLKMFFTINLSSKLNDTTAIPQDLKQVMNGLTLRDVNVDLIQQEPLLPVIQSDNIIERTALLNRCLNALNDGKILVIFGSLKIGKSTLAAQIHQHRPKTAIYDSVLQTDLENKVKSTATGRKWEVKVCWLAPEH